MPLPPSAPDAPSPLPTDLPRSPAAPARLLIYDRTCRGRRFPLGLSHAWSTGARLYRGLGRLTAARGVSSWSEALAWLAATQPHLPLAEVQFWGHGKWGRALIDGEPLDRAALAPTHVLHRPLLALRQRLTTAGEALLWFRTCETIGADAGHAFARALADFLGCRVAGHTHIIGFYQSGLHSLAPGELPTWSAAEGLLQGTAAEPVAARRSSPRAPHTITCLQGKIPAGY